jgi:hypothetical protein
LPLSIHASEALRVSGERLIFADIGLGVDECSPWGGSLQKLWLSRKAYKGTKQPEGGSETYKYKVLHSMTLLERGPSIT